MTAKRNPYVGMHPDLFPLRLGYPHGGVGGGAYATPSQVARVPASKRAVELTNEEAERVAASVRGETPIFVPLDQLDSDAIQALPRSAFTDAEWDELDEDDREHIEDNDQESVDRVAEMVRVFVRRYEGEMARASEGDEGLEEYFHETLGNEQRLENWMPQRRLRALHAYGDHRGLDADDVNRHIQSVMEDTGNYSAEVGVRVADSVWSSEISSSFYLGSDEWKEALEGMYEDEITRALKQIYKDTDHNIDISRSNLTGNRDVEVSFETGLELHMVADWTGISNQVESLIDEEGDWRERTASEAPPLPDVKAAPLPRPVQPIAYQWPDGYYVADIVEDVTPIDAVRAAGILGVPIKQKDAKKGGTSLEKLIGDGKVEYLDQPEGTFELGRIAMALESMDMGHCVGDANMGYMDGVRDGEIKILSLRRPGSKPLFTMEAELRRDAPLGKMAAQGMIKTFDQIKGKGNRKPGFDRGLDRNIYQSKAEAEPAIKAFKRDEVQKVIEFLDEKPNHWDGRFLDIADLQPALFVISALVKENDPWALELLRKYPTLLGAEPNKWVVITEAGAREWTAADESHARDQHMQAFPDEEILSIEPKTPAGPVAPVEPVRVVPLWAVVMATGVERAFAAATEEEAYELAARAYPDENIVGIRRTNPDSSCGHGACDGFCLPYRRRAARNPSRHHFKFAGVEDVIEGIRQAEPTYGYVDEARDKGGLYPAGAVTWTGTPGYLTQIPVKNVLFMEGNIWYPGHGAALLELVKNNEETVFEAPPARVYRVTAKLRKDTEKYERAGELEYQTGLVEPWGQDEQGEYYAQLMDGNHRAAAAILAGDQFIYVYVLPNTRENVYKKDMV